MQTFLVLVALCCLPETIGKRRSSDVAFEFTQPLYVTSIWENYIRKTYVQSPSKMGIYLCPSCVGVVRYKIISGDPDGLFKAESLLVGNFAYLRIHTRPSVDLNLNREVVDRMELVVRATLREMKLETSVRVIINVKDENDSPPIFPVPHYNASIDEDVPLFSAVAQVHATDADEGLNGEVCYYLKQRNAHFAVNPVTGVVSIVRPVSCDAGERRFQLEVVAEDRASRLFPGQRSALKPNTASVFVSVRPVDSPLPRLHCQKGTGCSVERRQCAVCHLHPEGVPRVHFHLQGSTTEYFTLSSPNATSVLVLLNDLTASLGKHRLTIKGKDPKGRTVIGNVSLVVAAQCPPFGDANFRLNFTAKQTAPMYTTVGLIGPPEYAESYLLRWRASDSGPWAVGETSGLLFLRRLLEPDQRSYAFPVVAHSINCRSKFTYNVTVLVEMENRHSPEFILPPSCAVAYLSPDMLAGMEVCHLKAEDRDAGDKLTYSLLPSAFGHIFHVDKQSGRLQLVAKPPLLNSSDAISVSVRVADDGYPLVRHTDLILRFAYKRSSLALLNVGLVEFDVLQAGVNAHPPVFLHSPFSELNIFENASVNSVVFRAEAVDGDLGYEGLLRYFIESGNEDGRWMMDSTSGSLSIGRPLDREHRDKYILTLAVQDSAAVPRKSVADLVINVLDSNDNKPTFQKFIYDAQVSEGALYGHAVIQLIASDKDIGINGEVSYYLVSKSDVFEMMPGNGTLVVRGSLDREHVDHYNLIVQAVDGGWPRLSSFALVRVKVLDVNDNAPECMLQSQRVELYEDIPPYFLVACVDAYDRDEGLNAELHFQLQSNASSAFFDIDPDTGCLRTVGPFDHAKQPMHSLSIRVADRGSPPLETECLVDVALIIVNRNRYPPEFDSAAYEASIYENEPVGSGVLQLKVFDRDSNSYEEALFAIVGGDGVGAFMIDHRGMIRSRTALDRETKAFYWLTVEATDLQPVPLASRTDVLVTVLDRNDNPPVSDKPMYHAKVMENCAQNTVILQVNASDADEMSYPLSFAIKEGNAHSLFDIHPETGILFSTGRKIDRETTESHQLEIEIKDNGDPPLSSRVLVVLDVQDENDNAPTFLMESYSIVVPPCAEPGQRLCRMFAYDEDDGLNGTVRYAVVRSTFGEAMLSVDEISGDVFCRLPIAAGNDVDLTIEAHDLGVPPLSSQTRVIFTFKPLPSHRANRPPVLSEAVRVVHAAGDEKLGSSLALIEASDPDSDQLWFHLKDSQTDTVALMVTSGAVILLKHSKDTVNNVSYVVTDGMDSTEGMITIIYSRVQYSRPVLDQENYFVTVYENASIGSSVLRVGSRTDQTPSVTYSLINSFETRSKFTIDAISGEVIVAEPLDRETRRSHLLMVEARSFSLKSCAFVHVAVLNANDHAPQFLKDHYEVSVPQAAPVGYEVTQVVAYDDDSSSDGVLTYSLAADGFTDMFHVHPSTGVITVAKPLPFDVVEHVLFIKVVDGGVPSLSSKAKVLITVQSSPESRVRFSSKVNEIQVSRSTVAGVPIFLMQAEGGGFVHYSLNDTTGIFQVNALSGCISLKKPLESSNRSIYDMQLIARNAFGQEDSARLVVSVRPAALDRLVFAKDLYYGYVKENSTARTVVRGEDGQPLVLSVAHQSSSVPMSSRFLYRIVEPWAEALFFIDAITGVVVASTAVDYEQARQFHFHVVATDVSDPLVQTHRPSAVVVHVENINDNPPRFLHSHFQADLFLPTAPGVEVLHLSAEDRDGDELRYALRSDVFEVVQKTGVVRLRTTGTIDDQKSYTLKAVVSDGLYKDEAEIVVSVQKSTKLRCKQDLYTASVTENSNIPKRLVTVGVVGTEVTDFTYELLNGRSHFMMNPVSGVVSFLGVPLDREVKDVLRLAVRVKRRQDPMEMAHCVVEVHVDDVNDCAPIFLNLPYVVKVARNASVGSAVARVQAVDFDYGVNAELVYECKELDSADSLLALDATSGAITLRRPIPDSQLSTVDYLISARDHGSPPLAAETKLMVEFVDMAQAAVRTSSHNVSVVEGRKALEAPFFWLNVSQDAFLTIVQGNEWNHFLVDDKSGALWVQKPLDRESQDAYTLMISAQDGAFTVQDLFMVSVTVLDVNDNPPVLEKSMYYARLKEDADIGSLVLVFNASDPDEADNGELRYRLTKDQTGGGVPFMLNALSGALTLTERLDFESVQSYRLRVECHDMGTPRLSGWADVEIAVEDVNDNPPTFSQSTYFVPVPSDILVGQMIGKFSAHDRDTVDRGRLRYTLHGDELGLFHLEASEAILTVNHSLANVHSTEYKLDVVVDDGLFSAQCVLLIKVQAPLQSRPAYKERSVVVTVPETAAVGSTVASIRLQTLGNVRYEGLLGDLNKFTVEPDSGLIMLKEKLDYEQAVSHSVIVGIRTDEGLVSALHVDVNVAEQNDHRPQFLASKYVVTASVDDRPGMPLLQLYAVDEDKADKVEYSFNAKGRRMHEALSHFHLDSSTGVLSLRKSLKNFPGRELKLHVVAMDQSNPPLRDEALVVIQVSPYLPPRPLVPEPLVVRMKVSEDAPVGTAFGRVRLDGFANYAAKLVESADSEHVTRGVRVSANGTVFVVQSLDRELASKLLFHVAFVDQSASSKDEKWLSMVLVIVEVLDVNDNAPSFGAPALDLALPEDVPVGHSVISLRASDPDDGDNGLVTYSILNLHDDLPFSIRSGWLITSQELDSEKTTSYKFAVLAKDGGSPSLNTTLTIEITILGVNNKAPNFERELYEFEVELGQGHDGRLGSIRAIDPDASKPLRYHIVKGNAMELFDLSLPDNNGFCDVVLVQPVHPNSFYNQSYELTVYVSDEKFSDSAIVRIRFLSVSRVHCQCEENIIHLSVREDLPTGQTVYNFTGDHGFTGTVESSNYFRLVNGSVVLAEQLNWELAARHHFYALYEVCAWGEQRCRTTFVVDVVDVNNKAPVFSQLQYEVSMVEHANGSYPKRLLRIHAVDYDFGSAGSVLYKFSDDHVDDGLFSINQTSGDILLNRELDREEKASYLLKIVAEDCGPEPLSSTASFRLIVLDMNDNPPKFTHSHYEGQVSEDAAIGTEVLMVEAFSLDEGLNAKIHYRMLPVVPPMPLPFSIDSSTGKIAVNDSLNTAKVAVYDFTVVAEDMGTPPLSSQATVRIDVADVNDHSPVFARPTETIELLENTNAGARLAHLVAVDDDIGDNGRVGYRLISSQKLVHEMFFVDEAGWLILLTEADREKAVRMEFKVEAFDFGTPSRSSFALVNVSILDVNDNPPALDKCNDTIYARRPIEVGGLIHKFTVSDPDEQPSPTFHFRLDSNASSLFHLSSDGALTLAARSLPEASYLLNLTVSDGELSTVCGLELRLVEDSKFAPEVSDVAIELWTYMGELPGCVIGRVHATDKDPLDKLTYEIETSPFAQDVVALDPETGVLMTTGGLDVGSYAVNVSVTDGKFKAYALVLLEVRAATPDMLKSTLIVRLTGFEVDRFTEHGLKRLQRVLSKNIGVKPRFVHVFAVDGSQPDGLDAFVVFQKDKDDFHNVGFIRDRLERRLKEMSLLVGVREMRLLQEQCTRSTCIHGACMEMLVIDESGTLSYMAKGFNLHGPKVVRSVNCHCRPGYGGERCQNVIDKCSLKPCPEMALCVPDDSASDGYQCQCLPGVRNGNCTATLTSDPPMAFLGNGYVLYSLEEPIDAYMNLSVRLKTSAYSGVVMFSKGQADFHCLELRNGFLRYRFDLGSGQNILQNQVYVADDSWHSVRLVRRMRSVQLNIDNAKAQIEAFGSNGVLNLNRASHVYFGGEIFYGSGAKRAVKNGFIGCLNAVSMNDVLLSAFSSPARSYLRNVRMNCLDEPQSKGGICAVNPCRNGGACSVSPSGDFVCTCAVPYFGKLCELSTDFCRPQPCLYGAKCISLPDSFRCVCKDGFSGELCQNRENYPQHCQRHQCANNAVCFGNFDGTYFCNCTAEWSGTLCDVPAKGLKNPKIAGSRLGITMEELITVLIVLLIIGLLAFGFVLVCRKRRRMMYEKVRMKRTRNEQILLDRPYIGHSMAVFHGDAGESVPPPLPPRFRSFHGHREKKPICFAPTKSMHLPTAQVRPLSFLERSASSSTCALQAAVNYGSAAEELDQMGCQSDKEDVQDWKSALSKMDPDSLAKLKKLAGLEDDATSDDERQPLNSGQEIQDIDASRTGTLDSEHPVHRAYHWDYSDWNSTLGNTGYPSFTRRSDANAKDDTMTTTRLICPLEDTDCEYAMDSGSDKESSQGTSKSKK